MLNPYKRKFIVDQVHQHHYTKNDPVKLLSND